MLVSKENSSNKRKRLLRIQTDKEGEIEQWCD